jgi:hypothetical protein
MKIRAQRCGASMYHVGNVNASVGIRRSGPKIQNASVGIRRNGPKNASVGIRRSTGQESTGNDIRNPRLEPRFKSNLVSAKNPSVISNS